MENRYTLGIDIGSTTAKLVLMEEGRPIYERYRRHYSRIRSAALEMLKELDAALAPETVTVAISGSAGLGLAESAGLPFVQEVYATGKCVETMAPDTGAVIELGGEDAKVIFFAGGLEERMNGTCAGGTGAFIDQMAVLLDMSVEEMDRVSLESGRIYPIASRCGVFAKTDIQPLLNQGAKKSDIAASIFQAVVNQTVSGLIQGRKISGKVMFLGGPLHYCEGLRRRFYETLKLTEDRAIFPSYALYAVAMGAAMLAAEREPMSFSALLESISSAPPSHREEERLPPLFQSEADYAAFCARHSSASVARRDLESYSGRAWLGIDCGSTTTKLVLIDRDKNILWSFYDSNRGAPIELIRDQLKALRRACGSRISICGCSVTGYGEELIKKAFHADEGLVETIAHYTAARHFCPGVEFILDIGGQDIKCFRIRNGAIDSIMLNEACSSGCGSFIETFARAMDRSVADFAALGIFARSPVDLGSRCTVFMNSSVKQSQKDGASVEDISAGLSVSVVKNALYKVIRAVSPEELGKNIVVQGGTFLNDAVLRAFELEVGTEVIRPAIAGLMGAYGAALHVMDRESSSLMGLEELESFSHSSSLRLCRGCANGCHLTVNRFSDGSSCISGNQCSKGLGGSGEEELPNLHAWKRDYISSLAPRPGRRGKLGIPLALSSYELAPLWHGLFSELGFELHFSAPSHRSTYEKGQFSIPSDTACYPAKIMHGHMLELLEAGIDTLFYPGLTYNVDEGAADNHYNCPIVAYYGELLRSNMDELRECRFLNPYLDISSEKQLFRTLLPCLRGLCPDMGKAELRRAVAAGFRSYDHYRELLRREGEAAIRSARERGGRIMILAGRPYHIDPEIGHGIDKLAVSLGFTVLSEDAVAHLAPVQKVQVLDQWTFHARLYRAAAYAAEHEDTELVQLVSFGCGVDAITTDELRSILEARGKFYTQIKIDEISNLGAVRIRLRSLLGALEERS